MKTQQCNFSLRLCIFILGSLLFFYSCSTSKVALPEYSQEELMENISSKDSIPHSDIILSYEINKSTIVDSFHQILDDIFEESFTVEDQDMTIALKRLDHGNVEVQDKSVLAEIPLLINVSKASFLGNLFAHGKINLTFISDIEISPDWKLQTSTRLENHEWIERPRLGIGSIGLPAKWLTDELVQRFRSQIAQSIDTGIKENFDLPAHIKDISKVLLQPYQLDSTVGGWVQMIADSIHLSSVINTENYSVGKLYAPVRMIASSRQPADYNGIIPPFGWKDEIQDQMNFQLWADVQYSYLTSLAKEQFVSHTFKSGNREIRIDDLYITGGNDKIYVKSQVSGSFNGTITIAGTPKYEDGILSATDVEWDIKTGNILHRAASWLGKGYIHDQLNNMLVFDLKEYIERAKTEIAAKLEELKEKRSVEVIIEWGEIDLQNLNTMPDHLEGLLTAKMKVHIVIDDLKKLN